MAFLVAACASSQNSTPAPATPVVVKAPVAPLAPLRLEPAGSYEFTTVVDGQTVTGTMQIAGTPGAYTGKILSNIFPEIPIVSASTEGDVLNVKGMMPDGELSIRMVFTGEDFKGTWAIGAGMGEFNGKKNLK